MDLGILIFRLKERKLSQTSRQSLSGNVVNLTPSHAHNSSQSLAG